MPGRNTREREAAEESSIDGRDAKGIRSAERSNGCPRTILHGTNEVRVGQSEQSAEHERIDRVATLCRV